MNPETIIYGDRVLLRPLREEDLPLKVKWYNDSQVRDTLIVEETFDLEGTRRWFQKAREDRSRVDFLIESLVGVPIGVTGLLHIDQTHQTAECFCVIGEKTFWGKGLGTEIHSILIQWTFEYLGIHKIWASIRTNNPAIYKVVQRLGFQIEGTLRKEILLEGVYQDVYRIGLLKEEFTPTHTQCKVEKSPIE